MDGNLKNEESGSEYKRSWW